MPINPLPEFYEMHEPLEMKELECSCTHDALEVCISCKLRLQTIYPEIPFGANSNI